MTRRTIVGAALLLALSGCGDDSPTKASLSAEGTPTPTATPSTTLAAACGHPGARVDLARAELPVRVGYEDCDFSGVKFYVDDLQVGTGPRAHPSGAPLGNLSGDSIGVGGAVRGDECYSFQSSELFVEIDAYVCPSPTATP